MDCSHVLRYVPEREGAENDSSNHISIEKVFTVSLFRGHTAVTREVTVTGVGGGSARFRTTFDALLASFGEFLAVAAFSVASGTLGPIACIQIGLRLNAASLGDGSDLE